jgi:hypothetical protein
MGGGEEQRDKREKLKRRGNRCGAERREGEYR